MIKTYGYCPLTQVHFKDSRTFPVLAQVLAWLPAATSSLFSAISFLKAMFNSQALRIASAIKGAKGDIGAKLGFMEKIKYEVGCTLLNLEFPSDFRWNYGNVNIFPTKFTKNWGVGKLTSVVSNFAATKSWSKIMHFCTITAYSYFIQVSLYFFKSSFRLFIDWLLF